MRHSFLDSLADSALAAQASGRAVQATAAAGASTTFQFFSGWDPSDVLSLIDEARTWADAADVATALELLPDGPVMSYGHDFTMANASGGVL